MDSPCPIPPHLRHDLSDPYTPWTISPPLFARLASAPSGVGYRKAMVLPTDPEWGFIWRYFHHDKPLRYDLKRVYLVHDRHQQEMFVNNIPVTEREAATFRPKWCERPPVGLRRAAIERWKEGTCGFTPFRTREADGRAHEWEATRIIPLWHGTTAVKCDSICRNGFMFFGTHPTAMEGGGDDRNTDEGFFGSGIYFTNSARYAGDVYGSGHLVLAWVSMREPFPIVGDAEDSDVTMLRGKGAYRDYNAHYIPVRASYPTDPCGVYMPTKEGETPMCDEYVVFQKSQTLPRFWIELEVPVPRLLCPTDVPLIVCRLIPHLMRVLQYQAVDRDEPVRKYLCGELSVLMGMGEDVDLEDVDPRFRVLFRDVCCLVDGEGRVRRDVSRGMLTRAKHSTGNERPHRVLASADRSTSISIPSPSETHRPASKVDPFYAEQDAPPRLGHVPGQGRDGGLGTPPRIEKLRELGEGSTKGEEEEEREGGESVKGRSGPCAVDPAKPRVFGAFPAELPLHVQVELPKGDPLRLPTSGKCEPPGPEPLPEPPPPSIPPRNEEDGSVKVSCGGHYSIAIGEDGSAYTFGWGADGQLGSGAGGARHRPERVEGMDGEVRSVGCGEAHTAVVVDGGRVFTFGNNAYGQLGDGEVGGERLTALVVGGIEDAKSVACGGYHIIVLRENGEAVAFGRNAEGQLGVGVDDGEVPHPRGVVGIDGITRVACGGWHTLFLLVGGRVAACGGNEYGQIGDGSRSTRRVPVILEGLIDVVNVAAGLYQSMIVDAGGRVATWGKGEEGQLGHGSKEFEVRPRRIEGIEDVVSGSCGFCHTALVHVDGGVSTFGSNLEYGDRGFVNGRLGHGEGVREEIRPRRIEGIDDVVGVSCGRHHTIVVHGDGRLSSFGDGRCGRLGHGNEETMYRPKEIEGFRVKR